jgi:hypothetical protein
LFGVSLASVLQVAERQARVTHDTDGGVCSAIVPYPHG